MKLKLGWLITLIWSIVCGATFANGEYTLPVKHEYKLSAKFCELRTNHFHAGIDVRSSKGVIGDSLFSVAEGRLSRIKIMSGSYGKVLYIDHTNGTTSVYAHMHCFHPKIEKLLKDYQYDAESTEIDIYLDNTIVQIDKGDYIGQMGNSGRSTGPHLHFELRDTKTEEPLNPFDYGFGIEESIPPTVKSLWVHELDDQGRFVQRHRVNLKKQGNNYISHTPLNVTAKHIGVAIETTDKLYSYRGGSGIYKIETLVNGDTIGELAMDRFSFNETRDINGLIDYQLYKTTRRKAMRLYQMQHLDLSIFDHQTNRGIITCTQPNQTISISVSDHNGNQTIVTFDVTSQQKIIRQSKLISTDTLAVANGITLVLDNKSLMEDLALPMSRNGNTISIGNAHTPLRKYQHIAIKHPYLDNHILAKNGNSFCGQCTDDILTTTIDELGDYTIKQDNTPPNIKTVRFNKNRKKYAEWRFEVVDNYKDDCQYKSLHITANIDGRYIRNYYDAKNKRLIIEDLDKIPLDAQYLTITATDIHDNVSHRSYAL